MTVESIYMVFDDSRGKLHFAPPYHSELPVSKSVTIPGPKKIEQGVRKGVRNNKTKKIHGVRNKMCSGDRNE